MYFINEEHKNNFESLMDTYKLAHGKDTQYESNIYLVSIPDLYRLVEQNTFRPGLGPLIPLSTYSEEEEKMVPSNAELTGGTRWLVQAGLSLYNGNPCDLDYSNSSGYALAFIQAFKIRNKLVGVTTI